MSMDEHGLIKLRLDALIKEAEFIRSESIICIEHVRRLAVYSTSIAGFALPIIAGLIDVKTLGMEASSISKLIQAIDRNHIAIQFVCIGASLTCFAFLRIYVGSFLQIFTFAKYFRDHITPSINLLLGDPQRPAFHWEDWLRENRVKRSFFIGDADLSAEPILIGSYVITYAVGFAAIGYNFDSFPVSSIIFLFFVVVFLALTYWRIYRVLRNAAKD